MERNFKNVEFSDGNSWDMDYCNLENVTYMGAGKIKFGVRRDEAEISYITINTERHKVSSNKWYVATVTVKSSVARKIQLLVQENGGSWKVENSSNTIFENKGK